MAQASAARQPTPTIRAGLTEEAAAEHLRREGYNELPTARRRSAWAIAYEVVREPMLLLLAATAVLYLFLGDLREALVLLASVLLVMGITFYQERRTERTLEALRDLSSPRALVIRDGERRRIAGREVVRDDLLVLAEGDRVPADAVVLDATSLGVDESLLTGESVPVRKEAWDGAGPSPSGRPGGDGQPCVFSGTLVVQGQGIARVRETGARTEIGQIGRSLRTVGQEPSPLQREIARLVRVLAAAALAVCVLAVLGYGLVHGDWLYGVLGGLTLAMSVIPEEFPVILTIFLALGAWRLAQRRVLTRRMPAIQALGSATVLCVDKTGTLTLNRMAVRELWAGDVHLTLGEDASPELPEPFRDLARTSALASQAEPIDPMERALHDLAARNPEDAEATGAGATFVREYPLSPRLLAVTRVWLPNPSGPYLVAAKGAPEAIAELCRLDAPARAALTTRVGELAGRGLRVLGVARARREGNDLPDDPHAYAFEPLGLVGLADPVRPAVPAAVRACHDAGIRVVMITGDYPGTALAIARQIGLMPSDACLTGPEVEGLSDAELRERVRDVSVFARVVPQQKLRLVEAFKANGEVVAMTGDGVNDAPALKAAHIGVAMGGRGTDVAREAAAVVLLDDDFASLVEAVRTGRRILDNLRKAMAYVLAIHVPIAGLALAPVLLGWPLVLLPVHIVFLELIIDPASSVVFEAEPEEADVMRRPPLPPRQPIFGRRRIALSLLQGASILVVVLAVYGVALRLGEREPEARALTFTTLVLANLGLIVVDRSWTRTLLDTLRAPNPALGWVAGGAVVVLGLALGLPPVRGLFRFGVLHPTDLAICAGAALVSLLWFEGLKLVRRRRADAGRTPSGHP